MPGKKLFGEAIGNNNQRKRDQWVRDALQALPHGLKILDIGAGECRYKPYCGHLRYTAQDFNQYDGSGNAKGLQTGKWDTTSIDIVSDIAAISVADGSFDAILCTEVLEHVPDPVAALREMDRLLAPGGTLILTAPFNSLTHFAPYHFSTGFNRYFYEHHLGRLGYDMIEISPNGNYFEVMAQEAHRLPGVVKSLYAGRQPRKLRLLKLFIRAFTRLLMYYNHRTPGSEDLQCYGYHVRARKK